MQLTEVLPGIIQRAAQLTCPPGRSPAACTPTPLPAFSPCASSLPNGAGAPPCSSSSTALPCWNPLPAASSQTQWSTASGYAYSSASNQMLRALKQPYPPRMGSGEQQDPILAVQSGFPAAQSGLSDGLAQQAASPANARSAPTCRLPSGMVQQLHGPASAHHMMAGHPPSVGIEARSSVRPASAIAFTPADRPPAPASAAASRACNDAAQGSGLACKSAPPGPDQLPSLQSATGNMLAMPLRRKTLLARLGQPQVAL